MSRKRCNRRRVIPMPPPGLRPKLDRLQVRDLSMAHHINLDAIAHGTADEALLWQVFGGTLTWWKAAQLSGKGVPEMNEQLALVESLLERYGRTGRIVYTGPELQLARDGVAVMDQLAELVDRAVAIAAADWSEARVNDLAKQFKDQPIPRKAA